MNAKAETVNDELIRDMATTILAVRQKNEDLAYENAVLVVRIRMLELRLAKLSVGKRG